MIHKSWGWNGKKATDVSPIFFERNRSSRFSDHPVLRCCPSRASKRFTFLCQEDDPQSWRRSRHLVVLGMAKWTSQDPWVAELEFLCFFLHFFFGGGSKWPTSLWLRCSWPGALPFSLCATQRRTPRMPVVFFIVPNLCFSYQLSASAVSGEMLGLGHGGTSSANCSFGCHPGGLRRVSERKVARKL